MIGRPSVLQTEKLRDEYVKIFLDYFFLHRPWYEICQKFQCEKTKVYQAIKWVQNNELKLPPKSLLKGAIVSVQERLKANTDLWRREHKKPTPSVRNIIELSRELREDSKMLYQLEKVYIEHFEVELRGDQPLTSAQILKLITGHDPNT